MAFIRLGDLNPQTNDYVRPLALATTADTVLATGALTPLTTARTAASVPEFRQLIADLPPLSPGYEYRSFRSPGSALFSFEFVRVRIEPL